jgi:hypothetical protein
LLACGLLAGVPAAEAQAGAGGTWVILQTAGDPMALIGGDAARRAPRARVMASSDCAEMRAGLYVLALPAGAGAGAARPGTYRKRCTARAGSLTARGLPAVDPSFAAMREPPVNFAGRDVVSSIRAGLLIRPWYVAAPEDSREGLRVAVDDVAGARRPVERDCTGAEVARSRTHIAVACAVEQVADQPVYRTIVYRASDLARVGAVPRCRAPQLLPGTLRCTGQTVTATGKVVSSGARSVPLR